MYFFPLNIFSGVFFISDITVQYKSMSIEKINIEIKVLYKKLYISFEMIVLLSQEGIYIFLSNIWYMRIYLAIQ